MPTLRSRALSNSIMRSTSSNSLVGHVARKLPCNLRLPRPSCTGEAAGASTTLPASASHRRVLVRVFAHQPDCA